jgi:hypothetical protein
LKRYFLPALHRAALGHAVADGDLGEVHQADGAPHYLAIRAAGVALPPTVRDASA